MKRFMYWPAGCLLLTVLSGCNVEVVETRITDGILAGGRIAQTFVDVVGPWLIVGGAG